MKKILLIVLIIIIVYLLIGFLGVPLLRSMRHMQVPLTEAYPVMLASNFRDPSVLPIILIWPVFLVQFIFMIVSA